MGLGLTAFARLEDRDGAVHSFGGQPLDWEQVQELVEREWPGGRPPMGGMGHGGHGSGLVPTPAGAGR